MGLAFEHNLAIELARIQMTITAPTIYRARDYNRRIGTAMFEYAIDNDGVIFLKNPPDDLGSYYSSDYHFLPQGIADYERYVHQEVYKVELIKRFKSKGRLLEIGSSNGIFLYAAQKAGFDVSAIEMSKECCGVMRRIFGATTYCSDDAAKELRRAGLTFDVITLWHSLEHMRNWRDVLAGAVAALSPSGLLIVAMPNPLSLQFRLFGKWWTHLDAPRHLYLIPANYMVRLGRGLGLSVELVTTNDAGSLGWNLFGWQRSLHNFGRGRHLRFILRKIGLAIEFLLRPWERREGFGSAYTVVYRKGDS